MARDCKVTCDRCGVALPGRRADAPDFTLKLTRNERDQCKIVYQTTADYCGKCLSEITQYIKAGGKSE